MCSTCKFVTNYRKKNFEAQVTLHNDNDTILKFELNNINLVFHLVARHLLWHRMKTP